MNNGARTGVRRLRAAVPGRVNPATARIRHLPCRSSEKRIADSKVVKTDLPGSRTAGFVNGRFWTRAEMLAKRSTTNPEAYLSDTRGQLKGRLRPAD